MHYIITHISEYNYNESVDICHNQAWLRPRNVPGQICIKNEVKIEPEPSYYREFEDFFGNTVVHFSMMKPHTKLRVTSKSRVSRDMHQHMASITSNRIRTITCKQARNMLKENSNLNLDARQYILESPFISNTPQSIKNYALQSFQDDRPLFDAAFELTQRIFKDFDFVPGFTTITTPPTTVFNERKGVCQDFAHFALACVRSVGLPARYISGYIETLPPPGKERLVGADASHAWFSVYIPSLGWFDFDPTNNQIPHNQHITVGWGRDYFDIPPLKGVIFSSGDNHLGVSVDVARVEEKTTDETVPDEKPDVLFNEEDYKGSAEDWDSDN